MHLLKISLSRRLLCAVPFLLAVVFMTCSSQRQEAAGLYNVDSIITTQIAYLIQYEGSIRKQATLNGVEKITTITPKDTSDWNEELAIFLELDVVNKPINKGEYTVDIYADSKSNLNVKSFTTTEDLPVRFLKVYYQKSMSHILKIEAEYREINSLYTSTRFLTMEFKKLDSKSILSSYSINGGQKMFLDDSVAYTIDGKIALKK